jgi:hypothetical protein
VDCLLNPRARPRPSAEAVHADRQARLTAFGSRRGRALRPHGRGSEDERFVRAALAGNVNAPARQRWRRIGPLGEAQFSRKRVGWPRRVASRCGRGDLAGERSGLAAVCFGHRVAADRRGRRGRWSVRGPRHAHRAHRRRASRQRNDGEGFVSSTDYASSFDALASVSSDIDPDTLASAMSAGGFVALCRCEYHLPNDKTLIRQDFRPGPR